VLIPSLIPVSAGDIVTQGLESQWNGINSISGHITSKGITGFSTDPDARPAVITSKIVGGKLVAALPSKILPPIVTVQCSEDLSGRFSAEWHIAYERNGEVDIKAGSHTFKDAWDGTTFAELRKSSAYPDSALSVQKGLPSQVNAFSSGNFLTNSFRFLFAVAKSNTRDLHPSLYNLENPQTYIHFIQSAKSDGTQIILGKSCDVFKIDGGFDVSDGAPITYRVYLDPSEGFYPIGWDELASKTSAIRIQYRVLKLGKMALSAGRGFQYPQSATITNYTSQGIDGKPQVSLAYQEDIDNVTLNNSSDDSNYAVDPGEADYIFDGDNKTIIRVPK
jgi:hypothetical protein